ncbi:hypothetical protein BR93DRAFT_971943 [Coniochaeta sp. PMI_546]|nr:hypothetical protein BR93DRAFT_971943 [Coniochaeta sp. PMI_546]
MDEDLPEEEIVKRKVEVINAMVTYTFKSDPTIRAQPEPRQPVPTPSSEVLLPMLPRQPITTIPDPCPVLPPPPSRVVLPMPNQQSAAAATEPARRSSLPSIPETPSRSPPPLYNAVAGARSPQISTPRATSTALTTPHDHLPSSNVAAFSIEYADPDVTDAVWQDVISLKSSSKRGGRARGRGSTAGSDSGGIGHSASASAIDYSESQATPGAPAFPHFDTDEPHEGASVHYAAMAGLSDAHVWVEVGEWASAIAAEYSAIRGLGLCEEEFATFAKDTFLLREPRACAVSEDRRWRAERMLQLVCPPKESAHWRIPPLLEGNGGETEWTWDIRPDCAHYALTFVGPRFVIWVLQPTLGRAGRWGGCTMKRLTGADCNDAYGVRELGHWINEIHRRGLSTHGPSCERAIKAVLQGGGVRTSDVHERLESGLTS